MQNIKEEVAQRLSEFIKQNFDSVAEAARKMQVPEGSLRYAYLNAKSLPGFEVLFQLMQNGCDIRWLMTGKKKYLNFNDEDLKKRIESRINILIKKFGLDANKNYSEEIWTELSKGNHSDDIQAKSILNDWKKDSSLQAVEFLRLAKLTETKIPWFLCGYEGNEVDILEGFYLSFPELELVNKLKNHPELFKKISKYVDSKLFGEEIDGIQVE